MVATSNRKRRAPSCPPGRPRLGFVAACSLAAAFLVVFAVDLALFATPAQAQTTVWSATLNPIITSSGTVVPLGCDNTSDNTKKCSTSARLSDDDFTDDGTDYAVVKFVNESDGDLIFRLDTGATAATQGLTLVIDGTPFVLNEADRINGSKTQWKWLNINLGWAAGTDVAVSLVVTDAPATGQPTIFGRGAGGHGADGGEGHDRGTRMGCRPPPRSPTSGYGWTVRTMRRTFRGRRWKPTR